MKKILLVILLAFIATAEQAKVKTIVWEKPAKTYTNAFSLEIMKVELTKKQTRLFARYSNISGRQFRIVKECYLQTGEKRYPVLSADSIRLGEMTTLGQSGKQGFVLCFKPLPMKTREFDFMEGLDDGDFKVFGIHDKDYDMPVTPVPAEYLTNDIEEDPMPELRYSSEPAKVRFKAMNYRKGMRPRIKLEYVDLKNPTIGSRVEVSMNDDGEAESILPICFPQRVRVETSTMPSYSATTLYLAPGREVEVLVDMMREDKAWNNGKFVGYKGYMARVDADYPKAWESYSKAIGNEVKALKEIKEYDQLTAYMREKKEKGETWRQLAPFGETVKKVILQRANLPLFLSGFAADSLTKLPAFTDYVLKNKREPLEEKRMFFESLHQYLSRYYALDKEASGTNADLARYCYYLTKVLGGERVKKPKIEDPNLSALYDKYTKDYQKQEEENKEGLTYNVHYLDMAEVAPEDILQNILDYYKGKAILIDIWATWCGPCRYGHKEMAPIKEELKNEDIRFVYVTSNTSPYKDWKAMIGDIPGDHYYLTREQYDHLLELYNSNGIPTYAVYDAEGRQTYSFIGYPGTDKLKTEIKRVIK